MGLPASAALQIGMLKAGTTAYGARQIAAMTALCQKYSQDGAGWARGNHPWENRTHAAEGALHGKVVVDNMIRARIAHGVYYGIFLERKYSGKWGVLLKVLRRYEGEFLRDVQAVAKGGMMLK